MVSFQKMRASIFTSPLRNATQTTTLARVKRKLVVNFRDERTRWAITPAALERLRTALPSDWQLAQVTAPVSSRGDGSGATDEALRAVAGAEIYTGFGFSRELFLAATATEPALRWVHSGAAGVAALLYPEMIESDVVITNSAGVHGPPMAETVIAAALHFARGFDFAVRNQATHTWDQSAFETVTSPVVELAGRTLGLLGFGGIGREVAQRAQALGMRVLATRRSGSGMVNGVETLTGNPAGVERVLRESDVVVVAMPSTPETRGLLDARRLALLQPHAILINVARGNIIVESELARVLREGRLRGAALDVFEPEPLSPDSPFWELPNVLVLPHVSATTDRFWQREADLIIENLGRYLRGEPLLNVVDKIRGY